MTEACVQLQDPLAPRGIGSLVPGKIRIDDAAVLRRPDVHYALIDLRASFYNVTCPVLRHIVQDAIPAVARLEVFQNFVHERVDALPFIAQRCHYA